MARLPCRLRHSYHRSFWCVVSWRSTWIVEGLGTTALLLHHLGHLLRACRDLIADTLECVWSRQLGVPFHMGYPFVALICRGRGHGLTSVFFSPRDEQSSVATVSSHACHSSILFLLRMSVTVFFCFLNMPGASVVVSCGTALFGKSCGIRVPYR
jgi:hypothetical protein